MIRLEKEPHLRKGVPWVACRPFVENSMAVLIHRVRYVTTHKIGPRWPAHLGIRLWCGNITTGGRKFTFLDAPPDGSLLCARCETAAIAAGQPTADQLAGRHVHLGYVVAAQKCCIEPPTTSAPLSLPSPLNPGDTPP